MQSILEFFGKFNDWRQVLIPIEPIKWLSPLYQVLVILGLLILIFSLLTAFSNSRWTNAKIATIVVTHMCLTAVELTYCAQYNFDITWFLDTDLVGWGWAIVGLIVFGIAIVLQYFSLLITLVMLCSSGRQIDAINGCIAYWFWGIFAGFILTLILDGFEVGGLQWEPILKLAYVAVILLIALVLMIWSMINGSFFKGILLGLYYIIGGCALAIFGFELLRILLLIALVVLGFAIISGSKSGSSKVSTLYTIRDSAGRTIAEDCERIGANTYQDKYGNTY